MRTITLHISDIVFAEMKNGFTIRMGMGSAYGTLDGVIGKIIAGVMNGDKEVNLQYKTEVKDGKK